MLAIHCLLTRLLCCFLHHGVVPLMSKCMCIFPLPALFNYYIWFLSSHSTIASLNNYLTRFWHCWPSLVDIRFFWLPREDTDLAFLLSLELFISHSPTQCWVCHSLILRSFSHSTLSPCTIYLNSRLKYHLYLWLTKFYLFQTSSTTYLLNSSPLMSQRNLTFTRAKPVSHFPSYRSDSPANEWYLSECYHHPSG